MFRACRMSYDRSTRRLKQLSEIVQWHRVHLQHSPLRVCITRTCSSKTEAQFAKIGDVKVPIRESKNPELIPVKYISENTPQSVLRHLRWIMQKDLLGQDVFLIGPPGPLRRQIALMYLELTKREGEYVSLSRDTTESDLKQRREILSGTASYIDQCAVRAALNGRILILEGIEKAERNVLPVLNNLLENREMQLDDGRFLVAADRYNKLLEEHSKEELDSLKLVKVSENFRVIALGLPIPRYQGNPLDPPLRSRFQARDITAIAFKEKLEELQGISRNVPSDRISRTLSFASTMQTSESQALGLPDFPMDNVSALAKIMNHIPKLSERHLIHRLYPHDVFLGKEGITAVEDTLKRFEIKEDNTNCSVKSVSKSDTTTDAAVSLKYGWKSYEFMVPAGTLNPLGNDSNFVTTQYHDQLLADMLQSHSVKDFCIIGPRGCGKSVLVQKFADHLGYHVEQIMLYQDMTSRDLIQQRTTLPNGDTVWRPSPLITAARDGSLAVLDGVHRINPGSFSILHRLIHERELQLYDGTRLIRQDRFETIKEETSLTDEELANRKMFPIHPSFRIVALAEPPVAGSSKQQWLSPELLTMFLYHHMRQLDRGEELLVINSMVKEPANLKKLFDFVVKLRSSHDSTLQSIASSLSTRQLLRIARRLEHYPSEDLYGVIQKASLARFLPRLARTGLEQMLTEADIAPLAESSTLTDDYDKAVTCEVKDGTLRIGKTSLPVYSPDNKTKVPDILFYENPQHLTVMEDMLKDFSLGEHLLLVGNQGVGKNKIIDRFLQLLNRPREYLQLHRDTTVQTLTLQSTVRDGVIIYEDSPLVRAVKMGHILVVDEADKAPTHVTCILKTLVESGEMHLSDGRRIVSAKSGIRSENTILAHPDFRMMVLANRPGFPFLGNDFFGAMGDIFSCHAIDNPDMESEMSMLKQYGPGVPEATLRKLVLAFRDLREMADQGLITYPYSTREVVNMVKHLQKFPNDGLTSVVRNVFDFDNYNKELQETIIQSMQKHGIPLGASEASVRLAKEFPLPNFELLGKWDTPAPGHSTVQNLTTEMRRLNVKGPVSMYIESRQIDRGEARVDTFSEQDSFWDLPIQESNIICDVAVTKAADRSPGHSTTDLIHVATSNPIMIYSLNPKTCGVNCIDLYDVFPTTSGSYKPRVKLLPLVSPLDDRLLLHEEITNVVLAVNFENGELQRLMSPNMPETAPERRRFPTMTQTVKEPFKLCQGSGEDSSGTVMFYKENGNSIELMNILEGLSISIALPMNITSAHQVAANKWLLNDENSKLKYIMERRTMDEFSLTTVQSDDDTTTLQLATNVGLPDGVLSRAVGEKISSPNRVLVTPNSYGTVLVGFPDLRTTEVYSSPREPLPDRQSPAPGIDPLVNVIATPAKPSLKSDITVLPDCGQIIRALATWKVPAEIFPDGNRPSTNSGYLEVSDIANHKLRYIPVPGASRVSPYANWLSAFSDVHIFMAPMSNDGIVTVDAGGCVRTWETVPISLEQSIRDWRNMIGFEDTKPLQMTVDSETSQKPENADPKVGKFDVNNAPHFGGNQWAGGTGGSSTAGLGGFGGPYRLDAGHDVHQVPDSMKDMVPEEVRQAARKMGEKAFKQRLKEIQMSEYDGETYEKFSKSVRRQVQSMRVILDSLQAKGKERQWLKNQPYGDLDDARLIEGLTGEKAIYKRRGEKEPEMGSPQELPKLFRLLVDVSGSMYRFNGYDSRLEREMEAALMVMESFEGYDEKLKYDIIGHSGDDYKTELLKSDKPPRDNKERLNVLKTMHAHSQFCLSGDHTFEATKNAIKEIAEQEADERFVILLSDANFDRYGLSPKRFGEILTSNEDVNAYAIFIGSLGDQATRLTKQLPMGHSFICLDTKNLPQILQQIFTSTMLSSK